MIQEFLIWHWEFKIHKTPNNLALPQLDYIQNVLENFKYLNFKKAKISIDVNLNLAPIKGKVSLNWIMPEYWDV